MVSPRNGDQEKLDQGRAAIPVEPDLWTFSLSLYQVGGVPEACLYLQDALAGDVNILLFCLWVSVHGDVPVSPKLLDHARERVREWRERVVEPLRHLRRDLKRGVAPLEDERVEAFRDRVKVLELAAEREQQTALTAAYDWHREQLGAAAIRGTLEDRLAAGIDRYVATLTDDSALNPDSSAQKSSPAQKSASAQGGNLPRDSADSLWEAHRLTLIKAASVLAH